jgi:hypothetical protein
MAGMAGEIVPAADRVGIVCPVYDSCFPAIVTGFAERPNLIAAGYCLAVLTRVGIGGSELHQFDFIVSAHSGRHIDAAFTIYMPENFIPLYAPRKVRKEKRSSLRPNRVSVRLQTQSILG